MAWRIAYHVGLKSDYRGLFWRSAWKAMRRGQIEAVFNMGFVAHHIIQFAREAARGDHNASFYAAHARRQPVARRERGLIGRLLPGRARVVARHHRAG